MFAERLDLYKFGTPKFPVLSGLDGLPVVTSEGARAVLADQISCVIDWAACLNGLREQGCRVLLELGCGADLSRMAREELGGLEARSAAEFRSLAAVIDWVDRAMAG
jgi:[acyl-carrier-protein] S-malonyltransferase